MSNQAYVPYSVLLRQHEEAQKLKKVLDTKVTGTVKWFSLRYHYGFIERDDGKGDVFVHQMNITKSRMKRVYLRSLAHNEKVEFDVVEGKIGPEASNVTGPDGADVQGVYVIHLRYPIRPNPNRGNNFGRRRTTSDSNNRQRRRTENDDDVSTSTSQRRNRRRTDNNTSDDGNSTSPQKGQGQRRNNRNRRNRNRTISATNPNALEKKIADAIDDVGGVKVVKPNVASGNNKDPENNTADNNKAGDNKADANKTGDNKSAAKETGDNKADTNKAGDNKTSDNKPSQSDDLDKKISNDLVDDIGAVRVSN